MNIYKLLVYLTTIFFCSMTAHAQWTLNGNVLSTGNLVGIGTGTDVPVNNLEVRGGITASGSIVCNGGDIYISRQSDPWGYVVRPGVPGFKNLQFSCAGAGSLDNLCLNSLLSYTTGRFVINNTSPGSSLDLYFPPDATVKSGIFLHTPTFVNTANAQASYFIKAQDGGTGTLQFIVHGDGTTGINTDVIPGYTLSVNGPGIFTKLVVKSNIWADYVFDSAYKLRPLEKVGEYVKANHHLPEIPSADSVSKAGIDIGDNQAALLKKVEELTLYMIQLNETVKQQQEKISQLEGRLGKAAKKER